MSEVRYDGKTVVVTGGGGSLGRAYCLLFASRGANVVVNDLGGSFSGEGASKSAADKVVDEIVAMGGKAVASYESVSTIEGAEKTMQVAKDAFGSVHMLINNAGILRDVSFAKMSEEDWDKIMEVHMRGAFCMTKAAWPFFRDQSFGRVILTASAAGIYGNFGQTNYSAAKLGLYGMGQTLAHEGKKYNINTNVIAPVARSRMTETVMPPPLLEKLRPEAVAPLVGWLCAEESKESGSLFEVGAGRFFKLGWIRTNGYKSAAEGGVASLEELRDNWKTVTDFTDAKMVRNIQESTMAFMR